MYPVGDNAAARAGHLAYPRLRHHADKVREVLNPFDIDPGKMRKENSSL